MIISNLRSIKCDIYSISFSHFRERAPISTQLNAVDLYLVVCIFLVLSALLEYALILLLLKKRRKPKSPWTIEGGLKSVSVYQSMLMNSMAEAISVKR